MDAKQFAVQLSGKAPAAAAMIAKQALVAPGVFFYNVLLTTPEVQKLKADAVHAPIFHALELMSFGVFHQLAAQPKETRDLFTGSVTHKLRELSVVSLAATKKLLKYSDLKEATGLTDVRELEDVVIDCITDGLLSGRIDQKNGAVEVFHVVSRDVQLDEIDKMIGEMKAWLDRCTVVEQGLRKSTGSMNEQLSVKAINKEKFNAEEAQVLELAKKSELESNDAYMNFGEAGGARHRPRGDYRPHQR